MSIRTVRLEIVPFSAAHLTPRYVGWLNDPEVVRYSDQRFRRHTLESCRAYWQSFEGTANGFWAVVDRVGEHGHIGTLTSYLETTHSVANVGIMIGERSTWGHGYGLEAWNGLCGYLLRELGLRKVEAGTLEVNTPMVSIMRRSGMVEDGRRTRQCLFDGREVDIVFAALFNHQWSKGLPAEAYPARVDATRTLGTPASR